MGKIIFRKGSQRLFSLRSHSPGGCHASSHIIARIHHGVKRTAPLPKKFRFIHSVRRRAIFFREISTTRQEANPPPLDRENETKVFSTDAVYVDGCVFCGMGIEKTQG
ncbi:unnamed protein product [Ectocarpus sp. 6 AP-2014]